MGNTRIQIAALSDKATRLQQASATLSNHIAELEALKTYADNLMVNEGIWKGKEENKFVEQYADLKNAIKAYISNAEDTKETIDDDIRRTESLKAILSDNMSKR
ncbi:DUF5082 domain-containing protein [Virgibacillus dakarensis]|uniref:YwqH-like family protein n=1 Tax=Lentibacillus populi TaxID=1827502 RepID=UPI0012D8DA9D|nr:DUF5082 family protein [Lentibacillus populi]MTW86266.1 DUF5082 domain-containing protein [Virgibacillus dakarensis]